MKTDILIIGQGAAGLRAALAAHKADPSLKILIAGKGPGVSAEIMGFNAAAVPPDSTDTFYEDIITAGCGINNRKAALALAEGAEGEITFLEEIGVALDRRDDGLPDVLGTLGATYKRLVHYKALTGSEEMKAMRQAVKDSEAVIETGIMITDLLKDEGRIAGAAGIRTDTGEFAAIEAKAVILASGGGSAAHRISTYPDTHTGDGYAMALRAGAELVDMEFQQFEPCSFVWPEALQGQIVPTTLLRAGASLRNAKGEEFMERYGLTRDNARKGPLSRAIGQEILEGRGTEHGGIYYDMTSLPDELIIEGHSIFYKPAKAAGLDITKEPAEMAPAAHTFLGGVRIDGMARTCVPGLFACGEAAGGIHGADRIGGNAGAEVLVFGRLAGESAAGYLKTVKMTDEGSDTKPGLIKPYRDLFEEFRSRQGSISVGQILEELRTLASEKLGILRDRKHLLEAEDQLDGIEERFADAFAENQEEMKILYICRNLIQFLRMQIRASLLREESRGVFNRTDFPDPDAAWEKNIIFRMQKGQLITDIKDADEGDEAC